MSGFTPYGGIRPQTPNRASTPIVPRERVMSIGQAEREAIAALKAQVLDLQMQNAALRERLAEERRIRGALPLQAIDADSKVYRADDLLRLVARTAGVTLRELRGECRQARLAKTRLAAYWMLHAFTGLSSTQIGRLIGDRDHTTVLHGLKRMRAALARLPHFDPAAPDQAVGTALTVRLLPLGRRGKQR